MTDALLKGVFLCVAGVSLGELGRVRDCVKQTYTRVIYTQAFEDLWVSPGPSLAELRAYIRENCISLTSVSYVCRLDHRVATNLPETITGY